VIAIAGCPDPTTEKASTDPSTAVVPPAPSTPFVPARITAEAGAMGTHLAFAAFTEPTIDEKTIRKAFDDAVAEIRRLEALMTTWKPDSEISRVNQSAGKAPVPVSAETFDVVKEALHAGDISKGTFDITFESLHGLWKFDQDLDPHPPTDAQVKEKLVNVGYKHVQLDATAHTIFIDRAGTQIGLGGIAKGYAVDKAAAVLDRAKIKSFYVQAGGDLFTRGKKPDGTDWQTGIRDPRGAENQYFALVPVSDHSFSTAGDYERSYVVNGKRFHHIIDPRTGFPATACRSVTIWAPTALLADEVDDAVFILGPTEGLELVESLDGVGAVIVDAKNHLYVSKRLEGKVRITGVPTDGI
jgi:thiamine biosynthesis lipoprotein